HSPEDTPDQPLEPPRLLSLSRDHRLRSKRFELKLSPRRAPRLLGSGRPWECLTLGRRLRSRTTISQGHLGNLDSHPQHLKSMKELCQTFAGKWDAGYYILRMMELLMRDPNMPLEVRWSSLKQGTKVWADRSSSADYARGVLIPRLAVDLYSSPSEVLIDWALKSVVLSQHYCMTLADRVHDAGQVISVMDNKTEGLKKEITVAVAEQRAFRAQALADHLKTELEEAGQR
ncbi:hypothetical protein BHE74_00047679, partial [Ensete ventricosum]